jgi:hypothetical protein
VDTLSTVSGNRIQCAAANREMPSFEPQSGYKYGRHDQQ